MIIELQFAQFIRSARLKNCIPAIDFRPPDPISDPFGIRGI